MNQDNNEINNNVPTQEPVQPVSTPVEQPTVAETPVVQQEVAAPVTPEVAPATPQPQGVVPQPVEPEKKSGLSLGVKITLAIVGVLILIAVVAVILIFVVLKYQSKQKMVINGTVDAVFKPMTLAMDRIKSVSDETMKIDLANEPIHMDGTINVKATNLPSDYKELERIGDLVFGYDLNLDVTKKKLSAELYSKTSSKDVLDFKGLLDGNNAYLEEKSLFDNTLYYDMKDMKDVDGKDFWTLLKEQFDGNSVEDLDSFLSKTQNYIKSSITDKELAKSNANVQDVNGNTVKATKTTLVLNNKNVSAIYERLYNSVINDKDYLKTLATISETDLDSMKEELKEYSDSLKEKAKSSPDEMLGEFNIYTNSKNKLVYFELLVENETVLKVTNDNGLYDIKIDGVTDNASITYNENTNAFTIKNEEFEFQLVLEENSTRGSFKLIEEKVDISFEVKSSKSGKSTSIQYNVKIKSENSSAKGLTLEINGTANETNIYKDIDINKNNAKDFDSVDEEKVLNNLKTAVSDTALEVVYNYLFSSILESMEEQKICQSAFGCVDNGDGTATCSAYDDDGNIKQGVICLSSNYSYGTYGIYN